jgi:hypothetical protein
MLSSCVGTGRCSVVWCGEARVCRIVAGLTCESIRSHPSNGCVLLSSRLKRLDLLFAGERRSDKRWSLHYIQHLMN